MDSEFSKLVPNAELRKLADALGGMRDSLMTVSMALTDLVTEMPSDARDEVVIEVKRYLDRCKAAARE
jgi:hypothetical protein